MEMKTIILAGGKSRRMGQNKALLPIVGKSIIQRIVDEFTPVSEEVILIANQPELYSELQTAVLSDVKEFKGDGPLAGILTGFLAAKTPVCVFVACDMPFASSKIGEFLIEKLLNSDYDAIIPSNDGRIHPLFGAYRSRIQPIIKANLLNGKRKVSHLLDEVNVQIVEKQDVPEEFQHEWEYCFWNMNTMEDYHKTLELFDQRYKS